MTYYRSKQPSLSSPPREIELKLAVPADQVDAIAAILAADVDPAKTHQVTTYFDTADDTLAGLGLSLRVRCIDGRYVQTLKSGRTKGVAADRAEWEWPIETATPDLALLTRTPLVAELPSGLDLLPVVTSEIDRTTRLFDLADTSRIEAALDVGMIRADGASLPVHELELELRQGQTEPIYRWALQLHAAVPLTIETESKAQRGYRLKNHLPPSAHKAGRGVAFDRDTIAANAFRRIVIAALGHLLLNQAAALDGAIEGVHQMRVAIRRLRTALTLFAPHLDKTVVSQFQVELRRVGQIFGEARDWDVFCQQTLPDTSAWGKKLRPHATAARQAAHDRCITELRAPPFTTLVLGMAAWAEQDASPLSDIARDQPIGDLAPKLLDRLAHKVCKRGRHVVRQSDTKRHALRKSLKRLRYAIEYLRPALPDGAADVWLNDCEKLQDTLGEMNDAVTAISLVKRLNYESDPTLITTINALTIRLRHQNHAARHELKKRWKTYRSRHTSHHPSDLDK